MQVCATLVVGNLRPRQQGVACMNSVDEDFVLWIGDKDWEELNLCHEKFKVGRTYRSLNHLVA